ncbi:MAG TPA: hypothetical protein VEA18_03465 [Candidatus Kapabacteria bacterium]|nr:hypothetical protein [Candidatus Kapabacteria bacterium]
MGEELRFQPPYLDPEKTMGNIHVEREAFETPQETLERIRQERRGKQIETIEEIVSRMEALYDDMQLDAMAPLAKEELMPALDALKRVTEPKDDPYLLPDWLVDVLPELLHGANTAMLMRRMEDQKELRGDDAQTTGLS